MKTLLAIAATFAALAAILLTSSAYADDQQHYKYLCEGGHYLYIDMAKHTITYRGETYTTTIDRDNCARIGWHAQKKDGKPAFDACTSTQGYLDLSAGALDINCDLLLYNWYGDEPPKDNR